MKRLLSNLFIGMALLFSAGITYSADKEDADKAASAILASIRSGEYSKLWKTQTSPFFKSKVTEDSFLANMAMGRSSLGAPVGNPKFVDMAYSKKDPATGYEGEIYAFNYLTTYASGKFYERIVVVKDKDGKFRMSGIWGTPAPK